MREHRYSRRAVDRHPAAVRSGHRATGRPRSSPGSTISTSRWPSCSVRWTGTSTPAKTSCSGCFAGGSGWSSATTPIELGRAVLRGAARRGAPSGRDRRSAGSCWSRLSRPGTRATGHAADAVDRGAARLMTRAEVGAPARLTADRIDAPDPPREPWHALLAPLPPGTPADEAGRVAPRSWRRRRDRPSPGGHSVTLELSAPGEGSAICWSRWTRPGARSAPPITCCFQSRRT